MFGWLDKISFKGKLWLLVGSAFLVIVAMMAIVMVKTNEIRIGGKNYERIMLGKDLIADIIPPPLFAVAANHTAKEMMIADSLATRRLYLAHIKELHHEFQQRVDYWTTHHLPIEVHKPLFEKVIPSANKYFDYALENLPSALEDDKSLQKHLLTLQVYFDEHLAEVNALVKLSNTWVVETQQLGLDAGETMNKVLMLLASLGLAMVGLIGWVVIRSLTLEANITTRIKQGLDAVNANAMIADPDGNIIYMNRSVMTMMRNAEKDIRKDLPSFDVNTLLGANFDVFHKNPAHQRGMVSSLRDTYKGQIVVGGRTFSLIANPIFNEKKERLGTIVEWQDLTAELKRLAEESIANDANGRIKQALDSVTTNAMIADPDGNIVYMNQSVEGMLRSVESDLRKALPHFNVDKVLGANFDIFHKNPAHQRNLLAGLKTVYKTQIEIAGKTFSLIANPVNNAAGKRIGTVVEWSDRTAEVAIEKEIDGMVEAAAAGDFTRQISLNGKQGFFKNLSMGLNKLVETTEVGINDVLRTLGAMSKGDLSVRITRDYQGSFGQLKEDVNNTNEKLTEIITQIRESASSINTGASEISQGVAELSVRSEEQASSLEETASSMEEMTSTVKQSAENAKAASDLAVAARAKAEQGGEVVQRAMKGMEEINASSKKIADIIGVVGEIAFQTNLLALNAAVEAARAGEQGRGFAVVAGEVRNLAQRSATAAKEIKELIRDSVIKVEDGSALVNESGGTLKDIVEAVGNVTRMIAEIASAADEQTSGIEQVNTAVAQMDEMTQQNAALVEEASSAAKAMADQAQQMAVLMEFFSVDGAVAAGGGAHMSASSMSSARKPAAAKPKAKAVKSKKSESSADEWEEF